MKNTHFLLGIDSDGTAFDSMNIKHKDAFIPAALEIWPMRTEAAERFSQIEQDINLYSEFRGINRFPGLLMTMERLTAEYPSVFPDLTDLRRYVQHEKNHSSKTLAMWIQSHPSPFLDRVLAWSERADALFERSCKNIKPFDGVSEALQMAFPHACVAVISSAAKNSITRDWAANGLAEFVDVLMSQEDGGKQQQLEKAMTFCSQPVRSLMVGDTQMDKKAALAAGSVFFLICPGKERISWKKLTDHVLDDFFTQNRDSDQ